MNKKLLILTFTLVSVVSQAQSFFGSQFDNYAGIYSVINNPANIADSRYRTDVNVAGVSGFINNDYYAFQLSDALNDFEQNAKKSPSSSNNFYTNVDALLPSFQMNIDDKSAIAFFTRARGIVHLSQVDGIYLQDIQDDVKQDYTVKNQNFSLAYNSWAEVGVSYARVFINTDKHYLKGGISAKYLSGMKSGYVKASNVTIDYDYTGNNDTSTTNATGQLQTGNIKSFNDVTSPQNNTGSGFGTDLGITYEIRTDATKVNDGKGYNKYFLKLGISITDIGGMKYKNGDNRVYNGKGIAIPSANDDFDTYFTEDITKRASSFTVSLPTALHLNADLKMNDKFYLNLNTDLNMNDKIKVNSNFITNTVSLTPRYETKWLSLYLPMSVLQYSGFQTGFGFRAGPVTIGSGSVITGLLGDTKAIDVNVGLRIPIYQKK